ncbi:MAG: hypothetical protein JO300_03030 [Silvibacterium sp.]|nr:hypothetical protein [Silvibacterium sp.]
MPIRATVQEEPISLVSSLESTHLSAVPWRWLHGWLRRWDFVGLGFSLLPLLVCLTFLGGNLSGRTYGPSHWFATYQHGFLRRALIGEVLSRFGFLSSHLVLGIELATFTIACLLTALAFRRILFGDLAERRLAAFLLAAPAFLPHMAFMAGELDNFLYLAILIGAFALMRFDNLLGLAIATAATIVGLMIHEGFALMFYPLILALAADLIHRGRLRLQWVSVHFIVILAAFLAIIYFGKLPGEPTQWIAAAQQRTDMRVDGTVFLVLKLSWREQLNFVRHLYTPKVVGSILLTLALSIPYGVVLWRLVRTACIYRRYSITHTRLLLFVFAAPLTLSLLGHDVVRWLSAMCINVSLYLLLIYQTTTRVDSPEMPNLHKALTAWTGLPVYAATLLYMLALGPWGIAGNRLLSNIGGLLSR